MKLPLWMEIVGWYGAGAILGAYGLVSFEILSPESVFFQLLNISGAAGLMLVGWKRGMMQGVFLNTIWILVGLVALLNIFFL